MFVRTGTYTASVKVFIRNTWDGLEIGLRKEDADYIARHCRGRGECVPTLCGTGKCWYLDFAFEEKIGLPDTEACGRRILAVDLGINNACTCCVMGPDGTVPGRSFLKLSGGGDRLDGATGGIKRAQQHGARRMPQLWAGAKGISRDIAVKTAGHIVKTAVLYSVDVIVMEHLNIRGRKRGVRKQRLHHWRAMYVQRINLAQKAHRASGSRISTVCAWNTSRLAFDGSGRVKEKEKDPEKTS